MLSIQQIGSASAAAKYYMPNVAGYYLADNGALESQGIWSGRGAELMGLDGIVDADKFLQILEGRLDNGEQLGLVDKDGNPKHRPATDLTLSAPKSFSIMALVGGDKRLIDVHNKAVAITIKVIERMAAEARITQNKKTSFEKTDNLVVAQFQHSTSRSNDPLLHDHCLVMNMTKRSDGQWRSLSSRAKDDSANAEHGFREIIYQNQHYFGLIYNSEIAKGACEAGYEIDIKDRYGNFEIKGVSADYIEFNSKSHNKINQSLKEKGLMGAKAAEIAALDTRGAKNISETYDEIHARWSQEALNHELDLNALIDNAKQRDNISVAENAKVSSNAIDAIDDALEQLSKFNTQIKHSDLVRGAFAFARATISHTEIEQHITERLADKRLRGVDSNYYTTAALLKHEKDFVKQFKASRGLSFSIECQKSGLAAEMLRCADRVQVINVKGLTHEKNLIEELVHNSEAHKLNAQLLHVGRTQSNLLHDNIKRDNSNIWKRVSNLFKKELVQTVAGFKLHHNPKDNDVTIVHDAQKLSYRDLMDLEKLVSGKLILLNNTSSTEGFSAGSPIKALKEAGLNFMQSRSYEKKSTFDIVATENQHLELINSFAALSAEERKNTHIVATSNKELDMLNELVRTQLKSEGILSLQERQVVALSTQSLSDVQKKHAKFFNIGDQLTTDPYSAKQINYRIESKDGDRIKIKDNKGHICELDRNSHFTVTKTKELSLAIGDELVLEKNIYFNKILKFERGNTFLVDSFDENGASFKHNKTKYYFSNTEIADLALSHNYVKKPNQLQSNADKVLLALDGYKISKNTLGEIAEFSSHIQLFTHDKERAITQLDKEKLNWTIADVAHGRPSIIYRDRAHANTALNRDLEKLSEMLAQHNTDPQVTAKMAVSYAKTKLAEREAAFLHIDLLKDAMRFALGKASIIDVEKAIADCASNGELIHAKTYWISKDALALEHEILENNKKSQNSVSPITTNMRMLGLDATLTQGQKDAISLAATTTDRFVSVQGLAGVGKTTMMRELQNVAKENDFNVVGLAPMHTSKDELIANGIKAITIAKFLSDNQKYKENTLFIIDESSMIGNSDYAAIQKKIISNNARALFAGDITQLQSPNSGIPHELTIKSGTQKVAKMTEIMRQDASPILKEAVIHASKREIEASFEKITSMNPEDFVQRADQSIRHTNRSIIEIDCMVNKHKNYTPIYEAIAHDYLSRIPEHQAKTLVIAHTHEDRKEINALIRQGLQKQGQVGLVDTKCARLPAKSMTQAELLNVKNYAKNDILRFDANYSIAKKGEYYRVLDLDINANRLECVASDGQNYSINPANLAIKARMSVYTSETAQLATGDKIRLRLTDKTRGHIANKEYTVAKIEENIAHILSKDHKLELFLDQMKDSHWDYAYSRTAFGAQSATETFVIALELEKRKLATTHRAHEIDITRPRLQVSIYTENAAGTAKRLALLEGDKLSAHQVQTNHNPSYNVTEKNQINEVLDAQIINKQLTQKIESLASYLLGEKNQISTTTDLRFGSKDSISINTNYGLWVNSETGTKGNALQLIEAEMGFTDSKDAVAYAKDFLNCTPKLPRPTSLSIEKIQTGRVASHFSNKRAYAEKLVNSSIDIKGTLAERYLIHHGINQQVNAELKFAPNVKTWHGEKRCDVPALLSIVRDENNDINHVHVIRLDPLTGAKDHASRIIEQTYGKPNGKSMMLNHQSSDDVSHLTRSVEDGLSILAAKPYSDVQALLVKDNFLNVDISKLKDHVILCLGNEGDKTFKDLIMAKTANRLIAAGKTVSIAMPNKVGNNFNDLLKEAGTQSVARQLASAVDAKRLQKIYEEFSKGTMVNKEQKNYLKTIEIHEKQYSDKSIDLYKKIIKEQDSYSIKNRMQKELER